MRIQIKSNFFVPGIEKEDSVDMEQSQMSLREFLETLSKMAPTPVEYVRPGADRLDPDDWEVDINGIPYQHHRDRLETRLKDGDTVTIRVMAFGGG